MANLLIVEDDARIRSEWRRLLELQNHSCEEAEDVRDTLDAIKKSQEDGRPFDLILLDHELGPRLGIDAIKAIEEKFGKKYCNYRVVVITSHPNLNFAREYAKLGSISHLIKPVSKSQFWHTIEVALERRRIHVDQKEDWEEAYQVLEDLGILKSVAILEQENISINQEYQNLQAIHQQLIKDLENSKGNEQEIGDAYERACADLNQSSGDIESILPFLIPFKYESSFWKDIEDLFQSNRLVFYILQAYLKRIAENPGLPTKSIVNANKYYEYRVGSTFRLYYRKDANVTVLARFGHKNLQKEIIKYLCEH